MAAPTGPEIEVEELTVDRAFHRFVEDELLPGTGVDPVRFWRGLSDLVHTFGRRNRALLAIRASMQDAIDDWHRDRRGEPHDATAYRSFLHELGYLVEPDGADPVPRIAVDPEIGEVAGPQLVVPVDNARYAINAANARWGSLYDALYGTDAMGDPPPGGPYDPARGARVIAWVRDLLDDVVPLATGSHAEVVGYRVVDGELRAASADGGTTGLAEPSAFRGHLGDPDAPTSILLSHHGLGIEIVVDRSTQIGRDDDAGVADVHLEAAVTTIMDCEDSVAAVDAADKIGVYRNWLGLMRGDLVTEVSKGDGTFVRRMATDVTFTGPDGAPVRQRRRSLMLVRNVGLLMTTPVAHDREGEEVFEGLVDALVTSAAAMHDRARGADERNSAVGAIYVVKPKLHGPDEVSFTDEVFAHVEDVLGLPRATIRMGLMDEERRTTVNLATCIRRAGERIAFINTGFLDRTGDEMHTSMEAGPMVRKADMKAQPWLQAYEDANVDVGLEAGLRARAQIGKGMWAAPERMHAMLEEKIGHPQAGATCAWVPSPTAATLHATHYHLVDVHARQAELAGHQRADLAALLTIPVASDPSWSDDERQQELDNNVQGILGYVVRWVQLGIGCSKVPDIHDVALMEDRATCRISSQHVANWLHHGVIDEEQVLASFRRMARIVDAQNEGVAGYRPMAPGFDDPAYLAACDLVLLGRDQPSGYTEPILHARRAAWRSGTAGERR